MKKWIAILLLITMVLGLMACGNGDTDGTSSERFLKVGYGKACITPTEPVEMRGGKSTGTVDDLYAITVALQDEEGNTYIHIVGDLLYGSKDSFCAEIRFAAQAQLGISPEFITVGGTHTHSSVTYPSNDPANKRWCQNVFIPQVVASIQQAINDLSPAEMYIGRTQTDRLNFVRRYWLTDGTLYEGFTGKHDDEIVSHETDPDEEIQLVKFVREGKEDVLMVNWQSHATRLTSDGAQYSSDYVGTLRNSVESKLGVKCVFYQGAAGNLVSTSRIEGETAVTGSGWVATQKLGNAVADYVVDACESDIFVKVNPGVIHMKRINVYGEVRKYDYEMVQSAKKVVEYAETTSDNYEVAAYAAQFGIETIYHAKAIIRTNSMDDTLPYELNAISIGDVAFVTLPMEFFDTSGRQIKDGSPFEMTVLLGYTCTSGGYIADEVAYSHGGYESYNTNYVSGTAEIAVGHYLDTLKELYQIRFVEE